MAACSVCSHAEVKTINRWLLTGRRLRATAEQFGFKQQTLRYHKRNHLPYRSMRTPKATTVEEKLVELEHELDRLRVLAECGENVSQALRVIVQQRSLLELKLRKEGHLDATHGKLFLNSRPPTGEYEVVFEGGRPKTVPVKQ